jgi:hypothetical protein
VSLETRDALMFAISLLAAGASACLYVPAGQKRAMSLTTFLLQKG